MRRLAVVKEERADGVPEVEAFPNAIRLVGVPPRDTDHEQL